MSKKIRIVLAVLTVAALAACGHPDRPAATPTYSPPRPPAVSNHPSPSRPTLPSFDDDPKVWASWALLDRVNQVVTIGGEAGKSTTESMIKVAIGAQYLRNLEDAGREPNDEEHQLIVSMIQVSDNDAAQTLYQRGGGDAMLRKVIQTCDLRETITKPGWWSETQMTPADATLMGACIADGRVASPAWAEWLLNQMRAVHGASRFGIIDVRPYDRGRPLAIKNGYTLRDYDNLWHVNCLAIADWWVLEVMVRYPADLGLVYGDGVCGQVAAALLPPDELSPTPEVEVGDSQVQVVDAGRLLRGRVGEQAPAVPAG